MKKIAEMMLMIMNDISNWMKGKENYGEKRNENQQ